MAEHESYAALARQVAEMRAELAGHGTGLDEIRTSLATFSARLDTETGPVMVLQAGQKRLREQLDALQRQVEEITAALANGGADDEEEPAVPRWDRGTPGELDAQFEELRSWVGNVLRRDYPGYLRRLPACWPAHGEAVHELSALRAEWQRIYDIDGRPALRDVQWWHERWLPGCLSRLQGSVNCPQGECSVEKARKRAQQAARADAQAKAYRRNPPPGPAGIAGIAFPNPPV